MRKRRKIFGRKRKVNSRKSSNGAFGKPAHTRTEEELEKRRVKTSIKDKKNKPESFLGKIGKFLGIKPGRK